MTAADPSRFYWLHDAWRGVGLRQQRSVDSGAQRMDETFTATRDALDKRVSALPGQSRAALFAPAAGALAPVYDQFVLRQGWGDALRLDP